MFTEEEKLVLANMELKKDAEVTVLLKEIAIHARILIFAYAAQIIDLLSPGVRWVPLRWGYVVMANPTWTIFAFRSQACTPVFLGT